MAYKTFVAGEEALAADVNTYLMGQTVARFSSAAARTSGLTAPVLNQLSMLDTAPGVVQYWTGTVWSDVIGTLLPRGRQSEVSPANYTTLGGAVIVPGASVTLPNVAARRHLVTASGYVRKNDASIGTAQIWLEGPGSSHDRTILASMSANFAVPWMVRFTYVNRPGILVALAALCDVTTAALGEMNVTVDDVGPQ